jgi:hypothetical protein
LVWIGLDGLDRFFVSGRFLDLPLLQDFGPVHLFLSKLSEVSEVSEVSGVTD